MERTRHCFKIYPSISPHQPCGHGPQKACSIYWQVVTTGKIRRHPLVTPGILCCAMRCICEWGHNWKKGDLLF